MRIPFPFKDLLPVETVKQLSQLVAQPALVSALKDAAQKLGIKEQLQPSNLQQILHQAGRWMESVAEPWLHDAQPGLMPGINATGELFSNRWCTHRMCPEVIAQVSHLQSRYSESTKLDSQLRSLLIGLTSAQSALVVPNISIAITLIALSRISPSQNPTWILPRVDCVRLPQAGSPQGGNIRTILDSARARTLEIGTTQDCTAIDFEDSLKESGSILLMTSPNALSADARMEHRNRGLAAAKQAEARIVEIVMDGTIHDLSEFGVASRVIADCWDKSTDFIIVPGDAFLGGPDCGVLLGTKEAMEGVHKLADSIGWHANSSIKAALLRTLQASEAAERWRELPIISSLSISLENLENRAQRLATQLASNTSIDRVSVQRKACRIGAGAWGNVKMDSSVLQLFPKSISPSALAEQFASCETPIWGNVQSDHVELVLRSMDPDEDRFVARQLGPDS
jgi:L-seryl-tRNA(Ser) seleniumtransferase